MSNNPPLCPLVVLLSVINCVNVTWAARVQNVFLIMKVLALVVISVTGFVWIAQGETVGLTIMPSANLPFPNTIILDGIRTCFSLHLLGALETSIRFLVEESPGTLVSP